MARIDWSKRTTAELVRYIRTKVRPINLHTAPQQDKWHSEAQKRKWPAEKLAVYFAIYERLTQSKGLPWKATTLCRISDLLLQLNCPWLSKSFSMLALCDESRALAGKVTPACGSYDRLLGLHGVPEGEIQRYASEAYAVFQASQFQQFPEAVLFDLDEDWKTEIPSPLEYGAYHANGAFILAILDQIRVLEKNAKKTRHARGLLLELLARYILACMPGARVSSDRVYQQGTNTDYDVVCSLDGFLIDFRTELGRYFIGECKAMSEDSTPYEVVAKFCRVLDSIKSKFGILFALNGITGQHAGTDAESEQLNVYRDRGIVIVVVTRNNLLHVANGRNFINILRRKYDDVRLLSEYTLLCILTP